MSCLGVLFALSAADISALRSLESDDERLGHVQESIEQREFGGPWCAETDKAWDAIHRCFAGGTLDPEGGTYPLNHVILGGESLYSGDDYIMSWKSSQQVRDIAAAISSVTEQDLRARYRTIDPDDYGMPLDSDDEGYIWDWFTGLIDLYTRAAVEGRGVLFTVDQ